MAAIAELAYTLEASKRVTWSTTQEKSISNDFPFDLSNESADDYVFRIYLQNLWLPESLMPLNLFCSALRRVNAPSSSTVHPLHALLDHLLVTVSTARNKYHSELPQILLNGGGAGEMEEIMMWYAVTHETADEGMIEHEPWLDARWRQKWLERLERRETLIQILLYMLKLSLPGPSPPPPLPPPKLKKRKKYSYLDLDEPPPKNEDYLEAFMDKLSTWQLLASLETSRTQPSSNKNPDERDWMQTFCENIVEPEFKSQLPELCSLLRSKVFPSSPFSDDTSPNASTSRASSPIDNVRVDRPNARAQSNSRHPSPAFSTTSQDPRALARSRSRSLSVSLAQEREMKEKVANAAAGPKRRAIIREISMSRVFKPKPKPIAQQSAMNVKTGDLPETKNKDEGTTLVEETPVKPRAPSRSQSFSQPVFNTSGLPKTLQPFGARFDGKGASLGTWKEGPSDNNDDDDDDAWQIESSPDILLFNPGAGVSSLAGEYKFDSDDEADMGKPEMVTTPSKPSKKAEGASRQRSVRSHIP